MTTRRVGWAIALWCASAVLAAAEGFTIATYNVENYVEVGRRVDGEYRDKYPKPEAEKVALRAVIRAADADVLGLEEMGPLPYLQELQRDLTSEGARYAYADVMESQDRDRHLALLSRRPWRAVVHHADLWFDYFGHSENVKRGLLEARFASTHGEIAIFVVHLKSRLTDRPDDPESALRRAGEAKAVHRRVFERLAREPSAFAIVMGDFNDNPRSRAVQLMTKRGQTPQFEPLPAQDRNGERWTHAYAREDSYSRIDYIFVTELLRAASRIEARIVDGPETLIASDHRPVVARIEFQ